MSFHWSYLSLGNLKPLDPQRIIARLAVAKACSTDAAVPPSLPIWRIDDVKGLPSWASETATTTVVSKAALESEPTFQHF